jgi:hypothetical protein
MSGCNGVSWSRPSSVGSNAGLAALVVAARGERRLYRIPLRTGTAAVKRKLVRVSMQRDNLRWTAGGYLLLSSHTG